MMRRIYLLAILAVLAGCNPPEETTPPHTPPSSTTTTATTTATTTTEPEQDPSFNDKRVNQLKDLQRTTVKVGGKSIKVWVMDDDMKRQEGMMWLTEKEVKDEEGMLFVFPDEDQRSFWMQNTVLPLDICYIGSKGKVVSVVQGKSYDETGLPSKGKAQYVLELKKGMAAKFGIKAGVTLELPKDAKAKDGL